MSDKTGIEWTDATWNPVRGCTKVSAGCENCYAMRQAHRMDNPGGAYEGLTRMLNGRPQWNGKMMMVPKLLDQPLRWTRPRRVFVNSMSDLFHPDVPFDFIGQVFAVMSVTTRHTFQVLTKRPERMLEFFRWAEDEYNGWWDAPWPGHVEWRGYDNCGPAFPFENVWLGVSVEDQKTANNRIPLLLETPAAIRWISAEPLLGPVDLTAIQIEANPGFFGDPLKWYHKGHCHDQEGIQYPTIDWVVVGGESGPGSRPMYADWARSLRDQCVEADVPFLFKQWGHFAPNWMNDDEGNKIPGSEWMDPVGKKTAGRKLDGRTWDEYPD